MSNKVVDPLDKGFWSARFERLKPRQVEAEVLLYNLAGDVVCDDTLRNAQYLRGDIKAAVKTRGDGCVVQSRDGAVFAMGDSPEAAIRDAIVMIANGALFQI
jgi:hydroxymethylpyrimidine/phosphomethylpyrimidine kinase